MQVADAVLVEPATVSYYYERAVPVVESYYVIVNYIPVRILVVPLDVHATI